MIRPFDLTVSFWTRCGFFEASSEMKRTINDFQERASGQNVRLRATESPRTSSLDKSPDSSMADYGQKYTDQMNDVDLTKIEDVNDLHDWERIANNPSPLKWPSWEQTKADQPDLTRWRAHYVVLV